MEERICERIILENISSEEEECDEYIFDEKKNFVNNENNVSDQSQTKRMRKRVRNAFPSEKTIAPVGASFKPIQPFLPGGSQPQVVFSSQQQSVLQHQMRKHFQLLVQTLVLAKQNGNTQIVNQNTALLNELSCFKDMVVKGGNPVTLLNNERPAKRKLEELQKQYMIPRNNSPVAEATPKFGVSVFDVPGLNLLDSLEQTGTGGNMQSTLQPFSLYFEPAYAIDMTNAPVAGGRLRFSPAEDRLLVMGLERYGTADWESIQQNYLPTKTIPQILNRYKNMSSSRAPENPIKAYKLAKTTPFSKDEIYLLEQGIKLYGYQWEIITKMILPCRQPSVLAKFWNDYQKQKIVSPVYLDKDLPPSDWKGYRRKKRKKVAVLGAPVEKVENNSPEDLYSVDNMEFNPQPGGFDNSYIPLDVFLGCGQYEQEELPDSDEENLFNMTGLEPKAVNMSQSVQAPMMATPSAITTTTIINNGVQYPHQGQVLDPQRGTSIPIPFPKVSTTAARPTQTAQKKPIRPRSYLDEAFSRAGTTVQVNRVAC